ncbi:MAG: hypothetical protein LBK28_08415 [Propionibacteriaceae bacterium]|jgi:hypothetical protein|nr:hypothetical protein [Propionibacteriaceae bacterium]
MKLTMTLRMALAAGMAFALTACAVPGASVISMKDYTGNSPNGTLGTVKYIAARPNHKGLEIKVDITGFGDFAGIDNSEVQAVAKKLVGYISVVNDSGYSEKQYFYLYYGKRFQPGNSCPLTLYYMIDSAQLGQNLRFVFDYTKPDGTRILLEESVNVFE